MRKVIVTGGAGYIGSHTVVELAQAGYEPIILDNYSNSNQEVPQRIAQILGREVRAWDCDCRDHAALARVFEAEGDVFGLLHFAAFKAVGESVADPLKYHGNNIGAMVEVLRAVRQYGVMGFVFSSSCTVYGNPVENPVTEDTPWQEASSPYGYTKQVGERMVSDLLSSPAGIRAVTLRYFNPIGAHPSALIGELPTGQPNNLVPFITQTAAGLREQLTIFGKDYATPDGTCVRDYIHVVDLAKAHVKALDYIAGQEEDARFNLVVNIGTGQGLSVLEVVQAFERTTGVSLNWAYGERRPGDVEQIWAASSGALAAIGWEAELGIEDALRDAWRWQMALKK